MMLRRYLPMMMVAVLVGVSGVEAAELSVNSMAMPPGTTVTLSVSGNIADEDTFGVTIMVEIVSQAGNTGTLEFTPAPPVDIVQLGDPWPWPFGGLFTAYDTDAIGSPLFNGSVDDNGEYEPLPVTYSGLLSGFPVIASANADGVWDVLLSTSMGDSSWEGLPTTLIAGTITVSLDACITDGECDDGNVCTDDACDAGICQNTNNMISCNDADPCTENDACSGGLCAGTAVDCSSLDDQCNVGVCNEDTGVCEAQPINEGLGCDDTDPCTENDTCSAGVCAGTAVDCSSLDDQCNVGVCNEDTGVCEAQPINEGQACDDALFCTTGETCSAGTCGGGSPTDCSSLDDQCNVGVCNETADVCEAQPANEGVACNDGLFCTTGETCSTGVCGGGSQTDCSSLDDQCNVGVCNETTDVCEAQPANEGLACSDGLFCTTGETCSLGVCGGGLPTDCSSLDDQCNVGVCNELTDTCQAQPANEGAA